MLRAVATATWYRRGASLVAAGAVGTLREMEEEPYEDPIEQLKLMNRWLGHIASRLEVLSKQHAELLAVVQSIATDVDRMDTNVDRIDDNVMTISVDTPAIANSVNDIAFDVDLIQSSASNIDFNVGMMD